jgi:hypothetical protein
MLCILDYTSLSVLCDQPYVCLYLSNKATSALQNCACTTATCSFVGLGVCCTVIGSPTANSRGTLYGTGTPHLCMCISNENNKSINTVQ